MSLVDATPYNGNDTVLVGNGIYYPLSHIGSTKVNNSLTLKDVFVVREIKKNLLSLSKLTKDHPVRISFTDDCFVI